MRRRLAALSVIALLGLVGCDQPLTTGSEHAIEVSRDLGAPLAKLLGGVYRVTIEPRSDGPVADLLSEAFGARVAESDRPIFADHGVMQYHPPSASYATAYGNIRLYQFDGDLVVLELFPEGDEAVYFPARVSSDGRTMTVLAYTCAQIPQDFRSSQGIDDRCRVTEAAVLLRALSLMDLDGLDRVRFEWVAPVPDYG